MTSKSEKDRAKQIQDKCQTVLNEMLRDEDNKYCVDCDTKGPRWASWNIGIFLCIRCAGIHRNLGVHISKVKSVNLDTWTPEQVVSLQQMGNSKARAVYEANLPDNFRRPQSDSALESFVRAKYEQKKYIAREWVPQPVPKVNWEKEIDEEIERQKRKKKQSHITTDKNKPILKTENVTIPQLPKPKAISSSGSGSKSSSPKLNRNEASPNTKNIDLLGLDNQANGAQQQTDDAFSNFLSAPQKTEEEPAKAQSEEESFFNQAAPTEKEKTKLTKDSILALYANTPPQAPMYQLPMGPFQQSQPFVQAPVSFPTGAIPGVGYQAGQVPVQAAFPPAQGVFHSMQTPQFPAQNFTNATAFPAQNQQALFAAQNQQFNQFQSNSNVSQFQNTPFVNNQFATFPQQAVVNNQQFQGQFAGNFVVPGQNGSAPNPFYSQPQPVAAPAAVNIQQQFNNMSIGNAPPKSTILPAATANLWQ